MFALVGSFRAAARRQSRTLPAAFPSRASSSQPVTAPLTTESIESMSDLKDQLIELHERKEAMAAAPEVSDGIVDINRSGEESTEDGYPRLRGFAPGQFTTPSRFSKSQNTRHFRKRALLGPDAKTSKQLDIFHQLGLDPLEEGQNTSLLSYFVTSMGKIKSRSETNLTWKNQRKLGKAIRRARMMGLIPMHSRRSLYADVLYKKS